MNTEHDSKSVVGIATKSDLWDEVYDSLSGEPLPTVVEKNSLKQVSADEIIADLESRGLGWSLDHTGHMIEARVWDWPTVIGRYRPAKVEPLCKMLMEALAEVDFSLYPVKANHQL